MGYRKFIIVLLCFLQYKGMAQEPLMAEGNMSIGFTYGLTNIYRTIFNEEMELKQIHLNSNTKFIHSSAFTNPMTLNLDYAVSDYTALGLYLNYFSFALSETHEDPVDTFDIASTGFRMAVQLRAYRFFVHSPRVMLYNYAGLGVRFKILKTDASETEKQMAYIHSTPETSFGPYSIASIDWGMGLRVLVVKNIGLMAEFGINPGIGQFGLFYRLMPRSRKKKDSYGW